MIDLTVVDESVTLCQGLTTTCHRSSFIFIMIYEEEEGESGNGSHLSKDHTS